MGRCAHGFFSTVDNVRKKKIIIIIKKKKWIEFFFCRVHNLELSTVNTLSPRTFFFAVIARGKEKRDNFISHTTNNRLAAVVPQKKKKRFKWFVLRRIGVCVCVSSLLARGSTYFLQQQKTRKAIKFFQTDCIIFFFLF